MVIDRANCLRPDVPEHNLPATALQEHNLLETVLLVHALQATDHREHVLQVTDLQDHVETGDVRRIDQESLQVQIDKEILTVTRGGLEPNIVESLPQVGGGLIAGRRWPIL
jgi:hypothetical protein